MIEPSITYSLPKKFRRQTGAECAANGFCTGLEKTFEVKKNLIVKFDADDLDNKVRAFYKIVEGIGVSIQRIADYISEYGIVDKLSGQRLFVDAIKRIHRTELKTVLIEYPLLLIINSTSKKIGGNRIAKFLDYNKNPEKTHLTNIFEYTRKGWGIVDSNYSYAYYVSEEDLQQIYRSAYYIIL